MHETPKSAMFRRQKLSHLSSPSTSPALSRMTRNRGRGRGRGRGGKKQGPNASHGPMLPTLHSLEAELEGSDMAPSQKRRRVREPSQEDPGSDEGHGTAHSDLTQVTSSGREVSRLNLVRGNHIMLTVYVNSPWPCLPVSAPMRSATQVVAQRRRQALYPALWPRSRRKLQRSGHKRKLLTMQKPPKQQPKLQSALRTGTNWPPC